MAKLTTIVGYAHWASHLVNGDPSNLSDTEFAAMQAWLKFHNYYDHDCASCSEVSFFDRPDMPGALQGECLTYHFYPRQK